MADYLKEGRQDGKVESKRTIVGMFLSWEPMLFLITITVLGMAFDYLHPVLQPFLEKHVSCTGLKKVSRQPF